MIKIEKIQELHSVYDLSVKENHNFFANGILVHNCQEITLPTTPIQHIDDDEDSESEIALCVLSAINVGELRSLDELESITENIIRALDYVITQQDYPVAAARKMLKRRSLGIGITNLAYYLAKRKSYYESQSSLELVDELMEYVLYYCIKASVKLAQEFGPCEWFSRTKYYRGILPIDTYNKNVDLLVKRKLSLDWDGLRAEIKQHGMRNSCLLAQMPTESSSVISNATNGIEPPREILTIKKSKQGVLKQLVPESEKLSHYYTLAFEMSSNKGINDVTAVMQKWIDQAISVNHYYNPTHPLRGGDSEIKLSEIAKDILYHYQHGGKTIYYSNISDGKTDTESGCVGGACSV